MICLLIIDPQVDFHPGGSLAVPNSDQDAIRIANFIDLNSSKINKIIVSMDTHNVFITIIIYYF